MSFAPGTVVDLEPTRLRAAARLLVEHLRRLRQLHRAGITPNFGDLDDLFDAAALLESSLLCEPDEPLPVRCGMPPCERDGGKAVVEGGALLCGPHFDQVRRAIDPRPEARRV